MTNQSKVNVREREPATNGNRNATYPSTVPKGRYASRLPGAYKTRAKTPRSGGGRRSRWKTAEGMIIERDYLHDTVEVYDSLGRRHLGDFDPWDGRRIGDPDPARSVE